MKKYIIAYEYCQFNEIPVLTSRLNGTRTVLIMAKKNDEIEVLHFGNSIHILRIIAMKNM